MSIVTAIYENGLLRPLTPLSLHEHQTVRIQIIPEKTVNKDIFAVEYLAAAGILTLSLGKSSLEPISIVERDELAMLAQTPGKPLSEMIIEERGER